MEKSKSFRTRIIGLRLTSEEYQQVENKCRQSTANKLSEYVRRILFEKPITFYQRNQSLDDFMAEMIRLRNELNSIGNNFNQSVKKLHTLDTIPEFRAWLMSAEMEKKVLLDKVTEIKNQINKIADKWLQ
ncbi:plasmid mobilization relaxosome protein MobC [Segetibacter sp. 3557_3]|uniref:plasmid mobilization protein n=1 Tax=Segetibacter sp. 3557_3 TaxID=2547429 RepID=UPI0010585F25|nr:plasmid mobilization relaxosome protein MobC [Segetibacter sp. 3557_3]TDH18487.1 plasmid mobilization relaxosome protein MobC [Segetibacter sp. 3557_3]